MQDILFSYLNVSQCPVRVLLDQIKSLPNDCWFHDPYRTVDMLPIFTSSGATSMQGAVQKEGNKNWTEYTPEILRNYLMDHIFNWMSPPGRVMVLRTPIDGESAPHIDCRKEDFYSPQHKLRIVLQGDVSSLFFMLPEGKVSPENREAGLPFVIDGRWPHGMKNDSGKVKYTLCIGSPWGGGGLGGNMLSHGSSTLYWNDYSLPGNFDCYFENLELRKKKLSL